MDALNGMCDCQDSKRTNIYYLVVCLGLGQRSFPWLTLYALVDCLGCGSCVSRCKGLGAHAPSGRPAHSIGQAGCARALAHSLGRGLESGDEE
jgi:hypothetical protein